MSRKEPIGKLDREITIQVETKTQGAKYGQPLSTYATWRTCWAAVIPLGMREVTAAKQILGEADTRFQIRFCHGLKMTMQILHDGLTFDIYNIQEVGRRQRIDIYAKARRS